MYFRCHWIPQVSSLNNKAIFGFNRNIYAENDFEVNNIIFVRYVHVQRQVHLYAYLF